MCRCVPSCGTDETSDVLCVEMGSQINSPAASAVQCCSPRPCSHSKNATSTGQNQRQAASTLDASAQKHTKSAKVGWTLHTSLKLSTRFCVPPGHWPVLRAGIKCCDAEVATAAQAAAPIVLLAALQGCQLHHHPEPPAAISRSAAGGWCGGTRDGRQQVGTPAANLAAGCERGGHL